MPVTFPQTPLFHYTSLPDLKAILNAKSLILTPLDQKAELDASLSFIQNVIIKVYPGLSPNSFNPDNINLPVYSFSLTTQKDSAALWQNFNPGGGFAVSIDPAQLSAVIEANRLNFRPCIYDESEKTDFILNTIVAYDPQDYAQSVAQQNPSLSALNPQNPIFQATINAINEAILNYAGILKDASRKSEQEWRVIANYTWSESIGGLTPPPPDPLLLDVVNSPTGSYVAAPLTSASFPAIGIKEIVIGPQQDMAQANADCNQLIADYGLTNVVITESAVPYQ